MTYYDLLDKLRLWPGDQAYVDPLLGVGNFGVCGNADLALTPPSG